MDAIIIIATKENGFSGSDEDDESLEIETTSWSPFIMSAAATKNDSH